VRRKEAIAVAIGTSFGVGAAIVTIADEPPSRAPAEAVAATCHFVAPSQGVFEAPDRSPACTPGQWVDADAHRVCSKTNYYPRPSAALSEALKGQVMKLYGVGDSRWSKVEADHYFPVWLGGATSRQNFWPEENYVHAQGFNHNPKDVLEFKLFNMVCTSHTMTPMQARAIFEGDWRKAYTKYVGPRKSS